MEMYRKSYFESHLGGLERLMQFLSQINKKIADLSFTFSDIGDA